MVCVELKRPNSFILDNYYVLNAIENTIIAEYPNITKLSNIERNSNLNNISFKENNFTINLQVRYLNEYFKATDDENALILWKLPIKIIHIFEIQLKL